MQLDLFDYDLPESAIAQYPAEPRDSSKLMVIDRRTGQIADHVFSQLPTLLKRGDVLVFNDSRVIRARLHGHKAARQGSSADGGDATQASASGIAGSGADGADGTDGADRARTGASRATGDATATAAGAKIELLLAHPLIGHDIQSSDWLALARPARRLKAGDTIQFSGQHAAEILAKRPDGSVEVRFTPPGSLEQLLEASGEMPLPPYIKNYDDARDSERYQTIYSQEPGSVAAPTAGLHFTGPLIKSCQEAGIQTVWVTLHVGLGTFKPVQASTIEEHQMHEEFYHVTDEAAAAINKAKREGRRVICVGTTSVRTLESAATINKSGQTVIQPGWSATSIFIYPGYQFKAVDALITNFHLPKSTLLMLVSAFYDRTPMLAAYQRALATNYRFFSYGDAMLIL